MIFEPHMSNSICLEDHKRVVIFIFTMDIFSWKSYQLFNVKHDTFF